MRLAPVHCFSIPSVYDSLKIEGRLYHPSATTDRIRPRAAIIAHPYAPLGGSYDDPVVGSVVMVLLKQGFIVGTFNFRGARGSSGRTSWTGKPELADYVSFYLLILFYMQSWTDAFEAEHVATDVPPKPLLILGGYSYGSMIASHLPSLDTITALVKQRPSLAAVDDIRARAEHLATVDRQEGAKLSDYLCITKPDMSVPKVSQAMGDSTTAGNFSKAGGLFLSSKRRREGSKRSRNRSDDSQQAIDADPDPVSLKSQHDSFNLQVCYLLISPLLSAVAGFTTMFSRLHFSVPGLESTDRHHRERKELEIHPTCVIYGDSDTFTASKKLDRWATSLQRNSKAGFHHFKIKDGGHFWHEVDSAKELRECLNVWLSDMESSALCRGRGAMEDSLGEVTLGRI